MSGVDKFFDQLGDFLKTILGSDSSPSAFSRSRRSEQFSDPDMQSAWDELNEYLDEDQDFEGSGEPRSQDPFLDRKREALRQDYANLEIPFGASPGEVRKAYKGLLRRYHPDINSDDPEKLRVATEITKKINISYRRIMDFERSREKKSS